MISNNSIKATQDKPIVQKEICVVQNQQIDLISNNSIKATQEKPIVQKKIKSVIQNQSNLYNFADMKKLSQGQHLDIRSCGFWKMAFILNNDCKNNLITISWGSSQGQRRTFDYGYLSKKNVAKDFKFAKAYSKAIQSSKIAKKDEIGWNCQTCTYLNTDITAMNCEICESPKSPQQDQQQQQIKPSSPKKPALPTMLS